MVRYWGTCRNYRSYNHTSTLRRICQGRWNISILFVFSGLGELFIGRWGHFVLQSSQNGFKCIFLIPTLQNCELWGIHLSSKQSSKKSPFHFFGQRRGDWFYSQISLLGQLWGSHFRSKSSRSIFFHHGQSMNQFFFKFVLRRDREWFRSSMWRSCPRLRVEIIHFEGTIVETVAASSITDAFFSLF